MSVIIWVLIKVFLIFGVKNNMLTVSALFEKGGVKLFKISCLVSAARIGPQKGYGVLVVLRMQML